eukprot:1785401-Prymnesium_polylepis.1
MRLRVAGEDGYQADTLRSKVTTSRHVTRNAKGHSAVDEVLVGAHLAKGERDRCEDCGEGLDSCTHAPLVSDLDDERKNVDKAEVEERDLVARERRVE